MKGAAAIAMPWMDCKARRGQAATGREQDTRAASAALPGRHDTTAAILPSRRDLLLALADPDPTLS